MTRVEPWWVVDVGFVTEDDIKVCLFCLSVCSVCLSVHSFCLSVCPFILSVCLSIHSVCLSTHILSVCLFPPQLCTTNEHQAIDKIIDSGKMMAGLISKETVLSK